MNFKSFAPRSSFKAFAGLFLFGIAACAAGPVRLNDPLPAGGEIRDYWISPGGDRVIYLADQTTNDVWELYSVPAAGGAPQKLNGNLGAGRDVYFHNIKISPDGSRVVYFTDQTTDGVFEAYSVPVAGGNAVKIEGLSASSYYEISPDSSRVVFFGPVIFPDELADGVVELYSAPITGGEPVKLPVVLAPETMVSSFRISPGGNRVAYRVYHSATGVSVLYSMDLADPQPVKLNGDPNAGESVQQDYQFSPDGSRVVHQLYRTADALWELYSVPVTGGAPVRLNDPSPVPGSIARDARFSPDGSRVVFSAGHETGVSEIYSVPVAGGTPVRLNGTLVTGASARTQGITPDSRVVYFADQTDMGTGLYSVPIAGGIPVKLNAPLPAGGGAYYVQTSADDSRVVYRAGDENTEVWELFSVPVTGGIPLKLNADLEAGAAVFDALLSPEGSRVIYRIDYGNEHRWELFSVSPGGGTPAKLSSALTNAASDDMELSFKISPDGSHVVYFADQTTPGVYELYSVPTAGTPDSYAAFALACHLTTPAIADEDGDGLQNQLEYALGLDPTTCNIDTPGLPSLTMEGGNHTFRFTVPSPGGQDVRLDIESSTDLVTWEVLATRTGHGPWSGPVALNPAAAGWETVAVTRASGPESRRAYRLAVRLVP